MRNVCGALPELWESMPQPESRALLDHIAPSAQSLGCAAAEAVRVVVALVPIARLLCYYRTMLAHTVG